MVVLDINPSVAGIAGDMFFAGLLELVENAERALQKINNAIITIYPEVRIDSVPQTYQGFAGKRLDISHNDIRVSNEELENTLQILYGKLTISETYQEVGNKILSTLFEAEQSVHRSAEVHLHELGTVDTIIDIIGPIYLLAQLKIDAIMLQPIATGYGSVKTAHGMMPVPAPATQYILQKAQLATIKGPNGEATTPTGIAIMASLSSLFDEAEQVIWDKTGLGFGTKSFHDRGNYLRLRVGHAAEEQSRIAILETNLDDISGEILGDALDRLIDGGALDVNYYPILMKKNRPAYTLRVLVKTPDIDAIAQQIMDLTGTLGVRVQAITRHIGSRAIEVKKIYIEEFNKEVEFRIKKGIRTKIEFDDIIRIAEEVNLTPLQTQEILYRNMEDHM